MEDPLHSPEPAESQRYARFAPLIQIGSLLVTGTIIWINTITPRLHRYSWATLIGSALGYTVFACGASAAITASLLFAVPRSDRRDVVCGTIRTSAAGAWFAPAIILLSEFSPMSLGAALVLVVVTTRLLYSEWRRLHPPEPPLPVWIPPDPMFGEADPPPVPLLKSLMPTIVVAAAMQLSGAAFAAHDHLLGGALVAMTTAMLTMCAISRGLGEAQRPQSLPRSFLGLLLTILLAAGLTVGGLRGRVVRGGAGGDNPFAGGSKPVDPGVPPGAAPGTQPPRPPAGSPPLIGAVAPDGSFPGVILQPEMSKSTMLVAPVVPNSWGWSHSSGAIPFEGEYWMFRFPYRQPPLSSFHQKGTPAEMSFHTPDHWPLSMEAHQKLDQALDLKCCSRIDVEIWNADLFPGTVSLELMALETTDKGTLAQSFGKQPVKSRADLKKDPVTAVSETVSFPIPSDLDPPTCHELEIIFRRDKSRADKSARVSIDRFVLVPR